MKKTVFGLFVACFLVMPLSTFLPVSLAEEGVKEITTADLKDMLEKDDDFILVNVLPKIIHDIKHIKGSISIPLGQIATSEKLPGDKDTPIVFYCLGVQ